MTPDGRSMPKTGDFAPAATKVVPSTHGVVPKGDINSGGNRRNSTQKMTE